MPITKFEEKPRRPLLPKLGTSRANTAGLGPIGASLTALADALNAIQDRRTEEERSTRRDSLANDLMNMGEAPGAAPRVLRATRPDGTAPDVGPVPFRYQTEEHDGGLDEMDLLAGVQDAKDKSGERAARAVGGLVGRLPGGSRPFAPPKQFAPARKYPDDSDDAVKYGKEFEGAFGVPLTDWTSKPRTINPDGSATLVVASEGGGKPRTITIPKAWVDRFKGIESGNAWSRPRGGSWRPPGAAAAPGNPYELGTDPLPEDEPAAPTLPLMGGRRSSTLPQPRGGSPNGNAGAVGVGTVLAPEAPTPVAKLPSDLQAQIAEIRGALNAKKISPQEARKRLAALGGR